jgi:hypothetical protein
MNSVSMETPGLLYVIRINYLLIRINYLLIPAFGHIMFCVVNQLFYPRIFGHIMVLHFVKFTLRWVKFFPVGVFTVRGWRKHQLLYKTKTEAK